MICVCALVSGGCEQWGKDAKETRQIPNCRSVQSTIDAAHDRAASRVDRLRRVESRETSSGIGRGSSGLHDNNNTSNVYMTSTKNSQGLPIAMRNDCLLPDRSCCCWLCSCCCCCWCWRPPPEPVPVCNDCSEPLLRLRLPLLRLPLEPLLLPPPVPPLPLPPPPVVTVVVVLLGIAGTTGICSSDSEAEQQDLRPRCSPSLLYVREKQTRSCLCAVFVLHCSSFCGCESDAAGLLLCFNHLAAEPHGTAPRPKEDCSSNHVRALLFLMTTAVGRAF